MVTASDPWQGHDVTALFTVLLTGTAVLVGLTAYLCSRLTRQARRRSTAATVWRDVSLAAVAAGLALYLWGLLHLLFLGDQEQAHVCERERPPGTPALVGRRGDFLPLRLVCEASDGRDYSVVVPGYINPTLTVLLLLALVAAAASGLLHHKQHTPTRKKG
ncbi:hypothetical protein BU52_15005 [Streptomyces toyocaensis]|uniref:Uncharacterized protein n=1 Tax=Streptomyces toyocaensis TaxID=55952 RepID=A0A081XS50_STRTO|nr:hypothetical protein [Streptomyces toyocaensis]KES06373.1 hypothetical protein BU52_15005 [Streptomyces toyocaensis]